MTILREHRFTKRILAIMDKPKTVTEIGQDTAKRLDIKQVKITDYIVRLENEGFLVSLTPQRRRNKPGRVYGLTEEGIRYKKQICKKEGVKLIYKGVSHVNWYDYGWCAIGSQKKAIMLALDIKPCRQKELLKKIREHYTNRNKNAGVTRQNLNDILKQMAKKGIAIAEEIWITKIKKRERPVRKYRLSRKGLKIKEQMLI